MKACFLVSLVFIIITLNCSSIFLVTSQADSCTSNLNLSSPLPFDTTKLHCLAVWDSHGFVLRYLQTSPNIWSFVLSAPDSNSYVAMGFSANGGMVGSTAVVGWISSNGGGGIKKYYLGGTSSNQVVPDNGNLQIQSNSTLITSQSSRVYIAFQLVTNYQPESQLIYAVGPTGIFPSAPSYVLMQHLDKISTRINYATGLSSSQASYTTLRRSHGLLNIMGWGILVIIGAIVARHFKQWDPIWFYLHTSVQSSAFILGLIGIICGFALETKLNANVSTHKSLGVFILVLGCLQVMAFLARPNKDLKVRKYWNWYHHNVGRILIIFSVANIFYGIHLGKEGNGWKAGYGIVLVILITISVVLEIRMWTRK
ncbi:Cytochrome b561 and DOMON domain-containing protein [Quillaja saponaria]|uniref:Cytochrome b561 and DOMON domain-containing protein n=1 Tax=Quillaja saponaria TaxID=32244 RepID=A0AAD7PNI3_QUISA|nr:Cytochrome b561 and DOMON domain-containing protein [Quillaja saponaria]